MAVASAVKSAVGDRSSEGGDLGDNPADEIDPDVLKQVTWVTTSYVQQSPDERLRARRPWQVQDDARAAAEQEIDDAVAAAQARARASAREAGAGPAEVLLWSGLPCLAKEALSVKFLNSGAGNQTITSPTAARTRALGSGRLCLMCMTAKWI